LGKIQSRKGGMMRGYLRSSLVGACLTLTGGAAVMAAVPACAQGSYSPFNETATAALARYLRTLASDPKDFVSLIGAGRAAIELNDAQAAAGFFARADEVNPRSPLPQAGMGAATVLSGDPQAALPYFSRSQQLGATLATIGCDRGLAYDLMGRQSEAQADYRAALNGPDGDEARRRLALSLAISGDRSGAFQALAPLSAKADVGAARTRAFVLALTGDSAGAMAAINAAMPGSSAGMAPFLQRLPSLAAGQKAAAANLGIFPDSNGNSYAVASNTTDRLAGIDQLLRQPSTASAPQQTWQAPVQTSYVQPVRRPPQQQAAQFEPKIWLQLASGSNVDALGGRFRQLKSKSPDLFDGLRPYVASSQNGGRLLIGPFRGTSDADTLAEDLQTEGIAAFKWSNSQTDRIAPLAVE
jgi:Flp pilus assembly protein TadD